ncbi:MAG: V-type ATP synthase subunit D [Actinomycetes bacterium]
MTPGGPRLRVPPGRAGRLQVLHRLATAQRAASMLDHKLRILRGEQERLDLLVRQTGQDWERACRSADSWLLRAGLLGGRRALRLADDGQGAIVALGWTATMGARYPTDASVTFPSGADAATLPGTAAIYEARQACRLALEAAARHAAATAAQQVLAAEIAATRMRLRAMDSRWIPRLEGALIALEQALDENEHADTVRLRRVADRSVRRERSSP